MKRLKNSTHGNRKMLINIMTGISIVGALVLLVFMTSCAPLRDVLLDDEREFRVYENRGEYNPPFEVISFQI